MLPLDITEAVFADYQSQGRLMPQWRIDVADREGFARRSLCTQFNETDLAFLQRLWAEEGLFSWFEHQGDPSDPRTLGAHTLVIADHNGAFAPNAQPRIRYTQPGAVLKEDSIIRWHGHRQVRSSCRRGTTACAPHDGPQLPHGQRDMPLITLARLHATLIALTLGAILCAPAYAGAKSKPHIAQSPTCSVVAWDEHKPVPAPAPLQGSIWTYIAGQGIAPTHLTLTRTTKDENVYVIDGNGELVEVAATYAVHNPSRKGQMALIRFPAKVGDSWEDAFEEEGEFRSRYEHYRYDYEEKAHSKVLGIETIDVAAGRFRVLHIVREAGWIKSNPRVLTPGTIERNGDAKDARVVGWTITHFWYAPTLGRAVMKASMRVGDPLYIPDSASILNMARIAIVELQSYEGDGKRCADKPIWQARPPESHMPIGYPLAFNDTWEWALQMHEHRPGRPE